MAFACPQDLPRNEIQEGEPVLYDQKRFGLLKPHARPKSTIEFEHDCLFEQPGCRRARFGSAFEIGKRYDRFYLCLCNEAALARQEILVIMLKLADGRRA